MIEIAWWALAVLGIVALMGLSGFVGAVYGAGWLQHRKRNKQLIAQGRRTG